MARIARVVVPDYPYHITQRGNYRQKVFQDDRDRLKYLSWINFYSKKFKLALIGYCLMNNHVHFIAVPKKEDSLARVFSSAHARYSQYFNRKKEVAGHLWQGRFFSCLLDEPYFMAALRYVERNPVRAKMVEKPWEWKWSSAGVHTGSPGLKIQLADLRKYINVSTEKWKEFIDSQDYGPYVNDIREKTRTGLPLAGEPLIKMIEEKLNRRLIVRQRGRPMA